MHLIRQPAAGARVALENGARVAVAMEKISRCLDATVQEKEKTGGEEHQGHRAGTNDLCKLRGLLLSSDLNAKAA